MEINEEAKGTGTSDKPAPKGPLDFGVEERMNIYREIRSEIKDERAAATVAASIIQARALKEVAGMGINVNIYGSLDLSNADVMVAEIGEKPRLRR